MAVGVRCDILCRGAISSGCLGALRSGEVRSGEVCCIVLRQLCLGHLCLGEVRSVKAVEFCYLGERCC